MKLEIKSYCHITNERVSLNGNSIQIQRSEGKDSVWLDDIYRSLNIQYLKFFKMDRLSKAGFLGSELIFKAFDWDRNLPKKDMSIIGFNRSSSLDDDSIYQKTIQDKNNYFPSPSVFVYTLANIVTGEIAIRNKIQGETAFFVTEKFDPKLIYEIVSDAFETDTTQNRILCGWMEYFEHICDVFLLYVEKVNNPKNKFTTENIFNLYKK